MNITNQTLLTHNKQVMHSSILNVHRPSDDIMLMLLAQSTQTIEQGFSLVEFGNTEIERSVTRCRSFFNHVGVLSVCTVNSSLEGLQVKRKEQNELFVWKCDQGRISNA